MKQPFKPYRSILTLIFALSILHGFGQKQVKTYKENFNIGNDAVLELNTSNADIEFDTWNKDQVTVEAIVEIEGLSAAEAKKYLDTHEVKIMGNSKKIEVTTAGGYGRAYGPGMNLEDLHLVMPDVPEMKPLLMKMPEMPELPEMAVMPPLPAAPIFNYDAYKRDGEKYLQEWQKEMQKNYGEDYQKKIEAWAEKMAVKRGKIEEKRREMNEVRKEVRGQMEEARSQRRAVQQEARKEHLEAMEQQRSVMVQQRAQNRTNRTIILDMDRGDNIYYRTSYGKNRNIKIKKTIKIKMPKSVRLKMNVRHGEVKLAGNTKNMSANLSYATLLANTIDGRQTNIMAAYTPVSVKNWNEGQLQADYSDSVKLKKVRVLTLNSISSNVIIDQMLNSALIKNSFGTLTINSVSPNFSDLDIFVENADLSFTLPKSAFGIQINSTASTLKPSTGLTLKKSDKNKKSIIYKGYQMKANNEKNITISSKYSDIVLK